MNNKTIICAAILGIAFIIGCVAMAIAMATAMNCLGGYISTGIQNGFQLLADAIAGLPKA